MAHYINTNSRNEDPVLYNYSAWSYAIRSLDSFLAVEMFNSYSPPNSPLLVPLGHMPFITNRFLLTQMEASSPSPLPSSPLPPSSPPVPSEHDSNIEMTQGTYSYVSGKSITQTIAITTLSHILMSLVGKPKPATFVTSLIRASLQYRDACTLAKGSTVKYSTPVHALTLFPLPKTLK